MWRPVLIGASVLIGLAGLFFAWRIKGSILGTAVRQGMGNHLGDQVLTTNSGEALPLTDLSGRVILLVNSASGCGYAPQYAALETLHQRYSERGLTVLALPTNDFMGQEPLSDADIAASCRLDHGVTFPLLRKGSVSDGILARIVSDPTLGGTIPWNFEKFLIDRQGRLRARIAPRIDPTDQRCTDLIDTLLAEPPPTVKEAP